MESFRVGEVEISEEGPLVFICGPCVIEGEEATLQAAHALKEIFQSLGAPLIFKSSYDKANRTSVTSFRGPGIREGLRILARVREETGLPVNTDVHTPAEALLAAEVCDMLQIPAFISRQTDLLVAAGGTGRPIFVKKGQFMAPWDMVSVVEKLRSTGNRKILLGDRGTTFGYNNLITDIRAIPIMQRTGCPVCFDATHSVQLPGGHGSHSGGQREFVAPLAKAAVAAGAQAVFIEAHPNPDRAKSDAATQLSFEQLAELIPVLQAIHQAVLPQPAHV
ncbi:MAG: 3-deoxy-8-phosphooctulonate synthase [Parachlamydiales bacterium]